MMKTRENRETREKREKRWVAGMVCGVVPGRLDASRNVIRVIIGGLLHVYIYIYIRVVYTHTRSGLGRLEPSRNGSAVDSADHSPEKAQLRS